MNKLERLERHRAILRFSFRNLQQLIDRHVVKLLHQVAGGPVDFEVLDPRRRSQAELLTQGVPAETPAAVDPYENGTFDSILFEVGADSRAYRTAVASPAHELQLEPVISEPGILEEGLRKCVAQERASKLDEDIL